jgi:hypothetical protein
MPTAPKLFSAVFFALVAALAAHVFIPVLPEGTQTKMFRELSAVIGFFCGWFIMGDQPGACDLGGGAVLVPLAVLDLLHGPQIHPDDV